MWGCVWSLLERRVQSSWLSSRGFSVLRILGVSSAVVSLLALAAPAEAAVIHGQPAVFIGFDQAWYGNTVFEGEIAPLDVISVALAETPASTIASETGEVQATASLDAFSVERDGGLRASQSGSFELRTLGPGPGLASVLMSWAGTATLTNTAMETVSLFGEAGYAIDGGITDFGPDEAGRTQWTIGIRELFPGIEDSAFGEFGREMVFGELCATEPAACATEGPYDFNTSPLALTLMPGQSVSYDFVMDFDLSLSKSATLGETPVPEPATLALLGFGLAGVAGFARRRPA
jgi:hypothetical protein